MAGIFRLPVFTDIPWKRGGLYIYSLFVILFGSIFVFFFPVGTVILCWPLFRNTPLVVVDENGFTDTSSFISLGFVPWEDVKSLGGLKLDYDFNVGLQKLNLDNSFLTVKLKHPKKYLEKMNPIKRRLLNINRRSFPGDVFISTQFLRGPDEDLAKALAYGASAWNDKNHPEKPAS